MKRETEILPGCSQAGYLREGKRTRGGEVGDGIGWRETPSRRLAGARSNAAEPMYALGRGNESDSRAEKLTRSH